MRIKCPKCKTVYEVANLKIPSENACARCFKCKTRFALKKVSEPIEDTQQQHINKACNNCERDIGKLEKPHHYKSHVVCHECFEKIKSLACEKHDKPAEAAKSLPANHTKKSKKPIKKTGTEPARGNHRPGMMNSFLGAVLGMFSNDMAIDLGTANTLIYMKRKGIVLNEPSVVALTDTGTERRVLAVGTDAKKMMGKTPVNIDVIRPLREGVIANFEVAGTMLKYFIQKVCNKWALFGPRIVIAVPSGITQVEKRAVEESAKQAGARDVFLIEEPVAAAIGADLPIKEPTCNMVVDIGGGTTEVAVISLAGIVSGRSLRVAGDMMNTAIVRYIKKKFNFIIGEGTAEIIKTSIGSAYPDLQSLETIEVKGWDLVSGRPRIISVDSEDIREAISDQIDAIAETIRVVLDQTPQELTADIFDRGIILAGGGALLKNLDNFLVKETGLPISVANDPLTTVVVGSGIALESINSYRMVLNKERPQQIDFGVTCLKPA